MQHLHRTSLHCGIWNERKKVGDMMTAYSFPLPDSEYIRPPKQSHIGKRNRRGLQKLFGVPNAAAAETLFQLTAGRTMLAAGELGSCASGALYNYADNVLADMPIRDRR